MKPPKQPALKPQDVIVLLKVATQENWSFASLAKQLGMSTSEVHAAIKRSELSRLIAGGNSDWSVDKQALLEFIEHGLRYSFPPVLGSLTRGIPTGSFGPALDKQFAKGDAIPTVWPDPSGEVRGASLLPLFSSAVHASRIDRNLYELLTIVDAIRAGSARERELAVQELRARLE